jgi:hypothetical protein
LQFKKNPLIYAVYGITQEKGEAIVKLSRRHFITACAGTGLALCGGGAAETGRLRNRGKIIMIQDLTQALFEKYTGQTFRVRGADGCAAALELVQVRAGKARHASPGGPRIESFSVFFEASPEHTLEQGSYTFSHPEMGTVEGLFMVPIVSAKPDIRTYEVSFSRIIED